MSRVVHAQVCIDFNNKCVLITTFGEEGRGVESKIYCGIEALEIKGITRISIGDHIIKNRSCLFVELNNIRIRHIGNMLKVEGDM